MKPIFWHRVGKANQEVILGNEGREKKITVGEFQKRFRQPNWCGYPDALAGIMGCWSLMSPGSIRNYNSCKNCDCRIERKEKT